MTYIYWYWGTGILSFWGGCLLGTLDSGYVKYQVKGDHGAKWGPSERPTTF